MNTQSNSNLPLAMMLYPSWTAGRTDIVKAVDVSGARILRIKVCRTCQSSLKNCICGNPVPGDQPSPTIWCAGQGENTRLLEYLKKIPAVKDPALTGPLVIEPTRVTPVPAVEINTVAPLLVTPALPPKPAPDLAEIKRTVRVLIAKGSKRVVEVRAIKTAHGTWSGYYNKPSALAQDTHDLSKREDVPNVYWTLQQIDPSLLDRKKNNVECGATVTTADANVQRYLYLPFDFDPCRDAKNSSSDEEKARALELATSFRAFLAERGTSTILADSGNGYHLLARIDMPVSRESVALVSAILAAADKRFGTCHCGKDDPACGRIKIDTSISNPSRILKAYGTVARKGSHTAERPWRLSRMEDAPECGVVSEESLHALLKDLGGKVTAVVADAVVQPSSDTWEGSTPEQMEALLAEKAIKHGKRIPYKNGFKWQLAECVFHPHHESPDSFIALERSGLHYFNCSHPTCEGHRGGKEGWKRFKEQVGGFDLPIASPASDSATAAVSPRANQRTLQLIPMCATKPKHVKWLWKNRILANKGNVFFGEPGLGKGFIGTDFIARMTTGRDFFDCPNENAIHDAIVCCAEDSWEETIQPRLMVAGADPNRVFKMFVRDKDAETVEEGLMRLDTDLPAFATIVASHPARKFIILIDPLATYVGDRDPNKDKEVRPLYTKITQFAEKYGVSFVLVAHPNKNEEASAINRLSGAKALTSVFRNTWLVEKDPEKKGSVLMLSVKGNLAAEEAKGGLRFHVENVADTGIEADDGETIKNIGRLVWEGETDQTADDVLQASAGSGKEFKRKKAEADAAAELREFLAGGARKASDWYERAAQLGLSDWLIRRVRSLVKVKWRRIFDVYYMATSEADLEKKKREIEGCSVEIKSCSVESF